MPGGGEVPATTKTGGGMMLFLLPEDADVAPPKVEVLPKTFLLAFSGLGLPPSPPNNPPPPPPAPNSPPPPPAPPVDEVVVAVDDPNNPPPPLLEPNPLKCKT